MDCERTETTFLSTTVGLPVYAERVSTGRRDAEVVLVLHGLGDHFGRHEWAVRLFTGLGYDVVGCDWPGCGRSGGKRGELPPSDRVGELITEVLHQFDADPVGVLAHSTGGFFLIHALAQNRDFLPALQWTWLSSPLLHPEEGQSRLKIAAALFLAKWFPRLSLRTGVRPVDCYHVEPGEDPAHFSHGIHDRITVQTGADLITAAMKMGEPEMTAALDRPLLFTQGSEDHVCSSFLATRFFDRIPEGEKTLLYVGDARHEPFREPNRRSVIAAIRSWLRIRKQKCGRASG